MAAEAPTLSAADLAVRQARSGRTQPGGAGEQSGVSGFVNARRKRDAGTEGPTVTLDRSLLVQGSTTGDRTELKRRFPLTLDRGRNRPGAENEIVVTPDRVREYTSFLKTYMGDLAAMADERDPTDPTRLRSGLDAYLAMPGRRQSVKQLVDLLTDGPKDRDGRFITRMVDEDKVKKFLTDAPKGELERHWALTTVLMKDEEVTTQAALGVDIISRMHKMNKPEGGDRLGVDRTMILDNIVTPRRIGRATLSAAETAAVTAAWWVFARGNEQLKATGDEGQVQQMWQFARNPANAPLLMYYRIKTGVDFTRINPDGTFQDGYNIDTRRLYRRIAELHKSSTEFTKELGVDEHDSPFDISRARRTRYAADYSSPYRRYFLGRGRYRQEPGLMTRFDQSVSRETDRLVAEVAGGAPDPFPGVINAGLRERLFRLQGYENIKADMLSQDVRMGVSGEEREERKASVSSIREKRAAMDNPETFRQERRQEINDEITQNTNRRTPVEERRTALREGEGSLGAATAALQAKEQEILAPELGVVVVDTIDNAIETRINALTAQLTAATTRLRQINGSLVTAQRNARQPLIAAWQAIGTSANPPERLGGIDAGLAASDAQVAVGYKGQIDEQNDLIRQLTEQRATLRTKRTEYGALNSRVEEATLGAFARNPEAMRDANASYDRFTVPPGPPPAVAIATVDEVRNETVDQLVTRLEAAGLGADDAERRRWVFEAKAFEEAGRTARLYPAQETAINYIMGTAAPPPDPLPEPRDRATIMRMGVVELTDQIRAHYNALAYIPPGAPAVPWGDPAMVAYVAQYAGQQARDAFQGTLRLFRPLVDARLTQEINYYDANIRRLNTDLEELGNLQPLKDELDAALIVIDDQESTFDRAAALVDNVQRMQELTSAAPIDVNDQTLTPAERAFTFVNMAGAEQPIPQGCLETYREIARRIAPHQNRERLMAALFRVYPPRDMATDIGEGLAFVAAAPGTYDVGQAFMWANGVRLAQGISEVQLQQTWTRIINRVHARAEAI